MLADLVAASGEAPPDSVEPAADRAPRAGVAILRRNHRFAPDGRLPALAAAIQRGDADAVLALLTAGHDDVRLLETTDDGPLPPAVLERVRQQVLRTGRVIVPAARRGEDAAALAGLQAHRLLCAHRHGPRGVSWWTPVVQRWLVEELGVEPGFDGRYPGLPLLVTANDYDNGLVNGDAGVVVQDGPDQPLLSAFARAGGPLRVPLGRLSRVVALHAMTVHASQGSQFAAVSLVLPAASSPLATRETLYTGVTRATDRVTVIGSAEAVRAAVSRPAVRASGLARRLRG